MLCASKKNADKYLKFAQDLSIDEMTRGKCLVAYRKNYNAHLNKSAGASHPCAFIEKRDGKDGGKPKWQIRRKFNSTHCLFQVLTVLNKYRFPPIKSRGLLCTCGSYAIIFDKAYAPLKEHEDETNWFSIEHINSILVRDFKCYIRKSPLREPLQESLIDESLADDIFGRDTSQVAGKTWNNY